MKEHDTIALIQGIDLYDRCKCEVCQKIVKEIKSEIERRK